MEPEVALSCSQDLATCPDPSQINPVYQLVLYPATIRHTFNLTFNPHLNGFFPSGLLIRKMYEFSSSRTRATLPAHPILLNFITQIVVGDVYGSRSSSLSSPLCCSVPFSPSGPNILLKTLYRKSSAYAISLKLGLQFQQPYETAWKVIFLCVLVFIFVFSKRKDKRLWTEWQ